MGGLGETDLAALDAAAHVLDVGVGVACLAGEVVLFISVGCG